MINTKRNINTPAIIYCLTSPEGKSYIGQTERTFDIRWAEHVRDAKTGETKCRAINAALRKYGVDNFTKEILLITNASFIDYYERLFIATYNTIAPNGYNLRDGGDGGCSDEMKAQMREGNNKKNCQ
jgi:group I intron endonuclease